MNRLIEDCKADDCKAAGTMYVAADNSVLLMRRALDAKDAPGLWSLPAGGREQGETALQAADRESAEETGFFPGEGAKEFSRTTDFVTFVRFMKEKFEPIMNEEHDAARWFPLSDLPTPMHPGLKASFGGDMDASQWEGVAKDFMAWAQDEAPAEEDPNSDRFSWDSPDQIKIVEKGTEPFEDEDDEIDEADVKPTFELEISE